MTCCNSCKNKAISIYKGFGTKWDNNDLISVSFDSEIDIDGFGAEFIIGDIVKTYTDIEDGFSINLTAQETGTLNLGPNSGTLVLVDLENNKRPFSTELPFLVKDWEDGDIELDGFNITINGRVEENKLNIKIDTSNPEKINEETIRGYIAVHNTDENAHQYIQGLITAEKERAEQVEGGLEENKADKATTLAGYGITDAFTKTEVNSTFATKAELTSGLSGKQNIISDLSEIRSNADAGKDASDIISTYGDIVTYNASDFATAEQGQAAESALKAGDNISLLANNAGYVTKSVNDLENYTKTSNLSTVALSGSYNDLSNKPTIGNGTLTIQKNGDTVATFTANSTSNQTANLVIPTTASDVGALPNTTTINDLTNQTQRNAINSGITAGGVSQITTNKNAIGNLEDLTTTTKSDLVSAINEVDAISETNTSNITTINGKIPSQATSSNQLADKAFVNSSIATNTANFIGTFNSLADLEAYTGTVTNNDYAFVVQTTPGSDTVYNRYKYSTAITPAGWIFEYALNNSSFTSNQWAAINSGASTTNIGQIGTNTTAIGTLSNLSTTVKTDLVNAINEVNGTASSAIQPTDLAVVATTGSYEDLNHKPTIPTVNNATLTIQKNGTNVATFTANSATNQTANITVPTQPSDVGAQPLLESGTNIKTINGNSVLGAGNLTIDGLPSQLGNNGKYLTTSGEYPYWATITQLPSQINQNGKYLRTDGTEASWVVLNYATNLSYSNKVLQLLNQNGEDIGNSVTIDSLPDQSGQSGKFLTTDGTDASWTTIQQSPDVDDKSISLNASNELQAVGVIDQQDGTTALKQWSGTKQQYDSILSKDENTIYNVSDEPNTFQTLLQTIYPVGAIYIGTMNICPLAALFGTWQLVAQDRVLQGADSNHSAGTTIEAGLPNITGQDQMDWYGVHSGVVNNNNSATHSGCFNAERISVGGALGGNSSGTSATTERGIAFDASKSNSIYGNSTTVQPPAYVVNIWQRVQ